MKLEVVTLAFNNSQQVRRTLASVALQSSAPERHLVVDGSSSDCSVEIRKLADKAGAEYIWRKPLGVYPAMNDALKEVSDEGFIWFLNSSDWFASPLSIATVRQLLTDDVSWLLGGLHRYRDKRIPFHPTPLSGERFVTALFSGQIGFPHPSAIMSKAHIDACGGFDETYRIAGDYALALKFANKFGAPRVAENVLAIHDPRGLTSRHRFLHFKEKSLARRYLAPSKSSELEAFRNMLLATISRPGRRNPSDLANRVLPSFSRPRKDETWPEGCLGLLDSWSG